MTENTWSSERKRDHYKKIKLNWAQKRLLDKTTLTVDLLSPYFILRERFSINIDRNAVFSYIFPMR